MSSTQYSIAVNKALASYGAKTHGSLERRVERLKRFTDLKNKRFAGELRLEQAREDAREAQKRRTEERIRQIYAEEEAHQETEIPMYVRRPSTPYNLRSRPGPEPESGLNLLCRAIENGFVNTNRG
jgi:hypothetical protein